jgi:hypothetical protein
LTNLRAKHQKTMSYHLSNFIFLCIFLLIIAIFFHFLAEGRFALKAYTVYTFLFPLESSFTTYYQLRLLLAIILYYKISIDHPRSDRRAPRRAKGGLARPTQHSIIFYQNLDTQFTIYIKIYKLCLISIIQKNIHCLHISIPSRI